VVQKDNRLRNQRSSFEFEFGCRIALDLSSTFHSRRCLPLSFRTGVLAGEPGGLHCHNIDYSVVAGKADARLECLISLESSQLGMGANHQAVHFVHTTSQDVVFPVAFLWRWRNVFLDKCLQEIGFSAILWPFGLTSFASSSLTLACKLCNSVVANCVLSKRARNIWPARCRPRQGFIYAWFSSTPNCIHHQHRPIWVGPAVRTISSK
jgi:hypothetical protein